MAKTFLIHIHSGPDQPTKAALGFLVALAAMKEGQYVRVRVDACPDVDLDAKVNSFQGGSGQIFSSLPAENATGNFVKVVQRLPVRILFDDPIKARDRCRMAPGMSVAPRVTVR